MVTAREFILNTTEHYYKISKSILNNASEEALSEFINNSQILLVQGVLHNDSTLFIHTKIQDEKKKSIVFYKTSAQDLNNEDAVNNINIITLSPCAAESLYQLLRQIYSPLLANGNDLYSNKLQKNLTDLESILRILTHRKGNDNMNVILSIEDELDYWKTMAQKKDSNKKEKEAASTFCELFEDISEEIRSMHSTSMSEVREAAENIGGLLDDVWRFTVIPYSRDRMTHVFDIIGHIICSLIQKSFSTLELWAVHNEPKDSDMLAHLSASLQVIQTWTSACNSLTETYWPNYALHTWNGNPYVPSFCMNFQTRLKEIHEIRSTYCQLNKLLTNNEKSELQTHLLFKPFENVNVWICNGLNTGWETAVSRFSTSLRPAESKIAEKLRPRLHNTSTKQMLYEFMRYRSLLERPLVKHALNNEMEIFVSSLTSMLKSIQSQLDSDEVDVKMYQPPEMSTVVQQVQWSKQMEAKVKDIQTCAEKYLSEFHGSQELSKLASQVLKDLKTMYTQVYEEWCRDLQAQAQNGSLQLSLEKPVVEFSASNQMMVVNFNPRLVSVQLEAQALSALGLPPPASAAALDTLTDALTCARHLQQVASFHNTLGERMIPSTRPMMLQAALDLSSLVQDQKAVYWDDAEQLANYTDKLKKNVLKLESQNSYLTSQHLTIRNIVEKLMDTELLAKQSEWKKSVKDIRDIIEKVESDGYKNTELWRSHWDWQLYKALECQYIKTLLSLHKHFPHVKVDLVLRGHMVRVQPPMEEIRVQHYNQLRRLVSMPAHFVGLQNNITHNQSIFTAIVDKHSWLGNKAVQQIEASLSSLDRLCHTWSRRASLACVSDLELLCEQHLKEPEHWEINFKACKAYGQAVAKMTFEDEKIEWISVGTAALRREMESQARALWACLIASLQASCRADGVQLDAFVANATVMLEDKTLPKNAKELAEVSGKQQALQGKMPEMEKMVENLKRKGHMLRTWGGDASVNGTIKEWQKIRELMISHQQMFEHQAEIVKSSLTGEWDNLNTSAEAWVSRWKQAMSRAGDARNLSLCDALDTCRSVFEARDHWLKLLADRDDLLKECEKFALEFKISEIWEQAEKLITEYVDLWTPLKDYNEEFQTIAEQEWIVFQKKLHLLDEFSSKWKGQLEPYTAVTLFIQQELNKYTDLSILLKYLRGTEFTERHWREVYGLLEIEYKKPDTLIVKDLLNVALNIKKNFKALQKISTSASSESAIRSALNDLELWFAGARFNIIYYNDKAKRPTPIVKDFKDILAKIEEQQWVVSSVNGGSGSGGEDACAAWDTRLRAARLLVRATHHAQRRWLYLEPILFNDDGDLGLKFRKVDQGFKQVTRILESDPRLSALLQTSRLQPMLDSISEQLLSCQSALNQYIDEKRSTFPRLYFLSDDDLLELLGQARAGADGRGAVMQTHLKKLFPGTTGVRLGPGEMSITALCSHYGEILQLDHPVDIDCPVEVWLKNLETEMRSSLKNMTLKCVVTNSLQEQDPFSLPTQILCLAQNIRFTEQAEKAIISKDLHKLKTNVEKENVYYAATEVEDESERNKRQALILQCAYYQSVIRVLIDKNVVSTNDWLWQKQLRFYLLNTKVVVAKMGLAQISYSYEYLGVNTGQFVRTELADDCFLILTQSLHLGLVGNPFGPAGTGKTESVKALGGLVGRLVLVFNCDEAMDAECMGRLLSGLALCGAWGCFDEFNRLTAETLATVSHQFASLLAATHQRKPGVAATALLNGKNVEVSEWCGVAATMNPVGRGYGGRRALPAALERVLRPIAMVQPRGDKLAAHLLAARCIPDAEAIAMDLYNVFNLASTLVSSEQHYDWGLRALKAAVGGCSAIATRLATGKVPGIDNGGGDVSGVGKDNGKDTSTRQYRAAARRLLALNNMSKLTHEDAIRFENILSVVFADVPAEESISDPIIISLDTTVKTLNLVHNQHQIQKCVELYEQLQQRMGVVIVGPPGSGKSTIRRLLKTALINQGKNIVEYIICPKAMSRDWLLGNIDHDTRQWTDGVISATALEISNQPPDVWSWVVCDGDIDPEWIESLNSVLDDNRLLTLPSGWRIQFGTNVNFIFETHSMEHASPATVSRMGIILLSDDSSCDQEVLDSWMQKADIENEIAKLALPMLQQSIKNCMQWFSVHKSDVIMKIYNITLVRQILTQFEYIVQNIGVNSTRMTPEDIVFLSLERSVLDIIKDNAVHSFHEELSDVLGPPPPSPISVAEWVSDSLYMSARLAACEPPLRACIASEHSHVLVVGSGACAKNLMAEYILKECNSTVITVDCTPMLEPSDIIMELKRNNAVRSGGRGAGGNNARVTLLVRALHRARLDSWGSSPVHSFLLQLIDHGGFWWRGCEGGSEGGGGGSGGVEWRSTVRMRVVGTARSASRLPPRLAAALTTIALLDPDDDELLELTTSYLKNCVDKNIPAKEISGLAGSVLMMFKEITETFHSRLHYRWNASHLKKWCENVKWYSPSNVDELMMAISSEANLIFRDRLVTDEEKVQFGVISRKYLKGKNSGECYFTCKLRGDGVYMDNVDYSEWYQRTQKLINQCLSEHEYNVFGETGAEVCQELAVLCPAVARAANGGIVVCIGSTGAGRRASAILAAAMLPATLFFINHHTKFNAQFKNAISSSGEGTRTLIVISESAATSAALAAIEALTRAHSLHSIPADMMPTANTQHMLQNIKQNLGIVICLDKDQDGLTELMEKYPLLYDDGHLVWLERWSDMTLREMPRLIVQRLLKENITDSKEHLETLPVEGFVNIYNSLDLDSMKAPCRYVNFVHTYYNIVSRKKTTLDQRQTMLSAGVEALRRARSEVATLQAEAAVQETALSDKQSKANQALDQISATVRATTDKKEEMHALKKNIEIENEKLQLQKKEIEAELASVEPVIAAARAAVGDIRPESLSEVRSLRAPPDVVRDVLEGVLRLMGIADTSWHSMKNFLSKRGVKEDIRCLDASQISASALSGVQKLVERRGGSFEASAARRASAAAAPLAAWVRANVAYAAALARVHPLQARQAALHKNLQEAENQLSALSSGLATVDERVAALKDQLGQHTRDAATLELRLQTATTTIQAAKGLLDQLAHEFTAWENDLEHISKEIAELNVRSLLAAAYIVYLPDLTEPQAREYLIKWSSLIGFEDSSFSVINFLSTSEKQLKWDAEGLPSDKSAIKNAVFMDEVLQANKCGFTPLIIDPDGEGIAWLKKTLAASQCDFVSQHSDKLHTAVQYAIRLGRVLVITEVDGIDESWGPLVSGTASNPSARLVLHCRDDTLPARLPPHYLAALSPLHFTARLDGLTDQLVHYALQQQNPEVNEKAKEIKLKKATLQKQQHELQENLLRDLSSNVDILHDANLLASLNKTRVTSNTILEALEAARAIERESSAACEDYGPSANRAAVLALAVKRLAAHRPLVALPIDAVLDVYVDAVRRAGDKGNINNEEIIKYLTRRVIERVLLGLHKKDKYIVVLHLLQQVYDDLIPEKLWQIFIGSYNVIEDNNAVNDLKKSYPWLPGECAKKIAKLKETSDDLYNRLSLNKEDLWKEFISSGNINTISELKISAFETVVAVAAMRPDSLYRSIVSFVDQILGAGVVSAGEAVSRATRCAGGTRRGGRPILLLGAHAADVLAAHAHSLTQVGIEEGRSAWEAAVSASRGGGWLALQVGASPFTQDLQAFLAAFVETPAEEYNDEFRLWIVSEDRDIPPLISNICVNVILEAPEGVKNNVMGTLSAWSRGEAAGAGAGPGASRRLACLALFHALLQERRAYIPHGWSQWYSWEWGEVCACADVLRSVSVNSDGGSKLVEALYAARVSSAPDRRVLAALHDNMMTEAAQANDWRPRGLQLKLPFGKNLQAYASAFDGLPSIDTPQLLGLPVNCRVAWEKKTAMDIVAGLIELNSTVSVTQKSNDAAPLKTVLMLWKKLMSGSPLIKGDYEADKVSSGVWGGWWRCVAGCEAAAARRGATRLHRALAARARGHAHAHAQQRTHMHKVPDEWQLLWAGPDSPDSYIREFCFRARAAVTRLADCNPRVDYMPNEVDLRSFLRPSGVVQALRARAAAMLSAPAHRLVLLTRWDPKPEDNADGQGLVVLGLRLSGCECVGGALVPVSAPASASASATAPASCVAPALLLRFVHQRPESAVASSENSIPVAVYTSERREEAVLEARATLARSYDRETALLNAIALYIAPVD